MTNEERKNATYIGSAEIRIENTERRDKLVEAAQKAGFLVHCTEAINISLSGRAGQSHWLIQVYSKDKLDNWDVREAKARLSEIWFNL